MISWSHYLDAPDITQLCLGRLLDSLIDYIGWVELELEEVKEFYSLPYAVLSSPAAKDVVPFFATAVCTNFKDVPILVSTKSHL
jgi:hypothetical protein